ncbi:MAG: helix-turn-helix transcriptional regulator [Acidimicrobiia bacterium]|nr:helix-turn-helix transcriptional regulator [Acidimicrobiia bacterium]
MDLGLFQKDVAKMFDVTTECVENWELNRHPPVTKNRRKVLDFLGSKSSFLPPEIRLGFQLRKYRKSQNLSQIQLSKRIGIRQNMISDIESGRHRILQKNTG